MSMIEAVNKYVGINFDKLNTEQAVEAAKKKGIVLEESKRTWGHALYECFDCLVEKELIQPTFIYDYPVEVRPLAKNKPTDNR